MGLIFKKEGAVFLNEVENYMDAWYEANRFSGTGLVYKNEDILLKKGYGFANEQYRIANTSETKYNIGSFTKQFTAVAILKLYEKGEVDLEEKVFKYFPQYSLANDITIHQLLTHTSGVPEHTSFEEYTISEKITPKVILERLNKRDLNFAPGTRFEYSNSNYFLLARIVEEISGLVIDNFYKTYLFEPIGLVNTGVSRHEHIIPKLAQGYSYSGEGMINADYYDMSGAYGSGFLYSSAEDIYRWIKSLLNGEVIEPETLAKMLTPYDHVWYLNANAGYGCFVKGESASEMSANGLISGFVFQISVNIKNDYGIILLSNNDTIAAGRIVQGIQSILVGEEVLTKIKPISNGSLGGFYSKFVGDFHCEYTGARFTISTENNQLYVDRLWAQQYKNQMFKLEYIEEGNDNITFACELCDGTFMFSKDGDNVIYIYDTFRLPYRKARTNQ